MSAVTESAPWRGTARAFPAGKPSAGLGGLALAAAWVFISGRTLVVAVPMLWFLVFFLVPFFVLGRISLAEPMIARPPYTPLFERDRTAS
jgi:putrescine transport system permease protein